MDLAAFWQESRRWVVGVALGGVAYLLGQGIIGSVYDPAAVQREVRAAVRDQGGELYDGKARGTAQAEAEALTAELGKLRAELTFTPDPRYLLEGKGMAPEDFLTQSGRLLKQTLVREANRLDVQLLDKDLQWPSPVVVDEIRGVLLGLDLIDETTARLFEAHRRAREADADAMGLRAIQLLRIEERRGGRAAAPRPSRTGEVDLQELLAQQRITFQFQAEASVAFDFLESCRRPGRTLVIETLTMTLPARPGDGVTVKGTLLGVQWKEGK